MRELLNYNIHDILTFQIARDKKRDFVRDLNLPFSFFETKEIDNPDIVLNIGKFTPSNNDCYIVDHKYYVKDNYFYCKDSGGTAKWEVEIFGFEGDKTIINFNEKILGPEAIFYPDLLPQDILLRPLIEYKLNKKGYFLIHAGGISKDNRGYILPGRGSSFKTTLCMDFVRKAKFDFLGDDRVILHDDKVLSFSVHLKAFEFKINNLPNETFRNSSNKLNLNSFVKFFNFIKYLHNDVNYENCKVPIVESSVVKALLFVTRTNKQGVKIREANIEKVANKLAINNLADIIKGHTFMFFDCGQYFYKYVLSYSFVFQNCQIIRHWDNLERNLKEILKKIPIYELEIPQRYDRSVFEDILKTAPIEKLEREGNYG